MTNPNVAHVPMPDEKTRRRWGILLGIVKDPTLYRTRVRNRLTHETGTVFGQYDSDGETFYRVYFPNRTWDLNADGGAENLHGSEIEEVSE